MVAAQNRIPIGSCEARRVDRPRTTEWIRVPARGEVILKLAGFSNQRSDRTSCRRSSPRPLTRTDLGAEDDMADRAHRVALDTHVIARYFLGRRLRGYTMR